jgi:hypothetical protein
MSDCQLTESPAGTFYCPHCQVRHRGPPGRMPRRQCTRQDEVRELKLGDMAESLLTHCGLTKDRYALAKSWLMRQPSECKCKDRQERLNRLGERFMRFICHT